MMMPPAGGVPPGSRDGMRMSPSNAASGRAMRSLALVLAIGLAVAGLLALTPARAVFDRMEVDPAQYSGVWWVYVPTEQMTITIYADPGDVVDLEIYRDSGGGPRTSLYQFDDVTLATGASSKVVTWDVPANARDANDYWVGVYDSGFFEGGGLGGPLQLYAFWVYAYWFNAWIDRSGYLPGDTAAVGWSATWIKNGSAAPPGEGSVQAYDDTATRIGTRALNASEGTFAFGVPATMGPDAFGPVYFWFNDTAGLHPQRWTLFYYVGDLGAIVQTGVTYRPGEVVDVDIWTKVTNPPAGPRFSDPPARGVSLNITVLEIATGAEVPAYGATGVATDLNGYARHVFRLSDTAAEGDYQVQVRATSSGGRGASQSVSFAVASPIEMSVVLAFDRTDYASGDTATATATVFRTEPATYTYAWRVLDAGSGAILAADASAGASYAFPIPTGFAGTLRFEVSANDGAGNVVTTTRTVTVRYGYLSLSLNRPEYEAGDTLTVTFSLRSNAITSPTYFYEVREPDGDVVASGTATGSSASFTVPDPAVDEYTFVVTASQGGRTAEGQISALEVDGYLLTIELDKPSYLPGETIRIHYVLSARGDSPMPSQFDFFASLGTFLGAPLAEVVTTSPEGDLYVTVPQGTSSGDVLLFVGEDGTGSMVLETVRIGATNTFWTTEIAGIPLFAVLLGLLVVLLLLVTFVLWRRGGAGARMAPAAGKPVPPPPPSGPATAAPGTGPMSVVCRHCGKPIDITTSKRPIEIMCPACGETQIVP